jgi:hypothetical protein
VSAAPEISYTQVTILPCAIKDAALWAGPHCGGDSQPITHSSAGWLLEAVKLAHLVLADRAAGRAGHEVDKQLAAVVGAITQQLRRHLQPCMHVSNASASRGGVSAVRVSAVGLLAGRSLRTNSPLQLHIAHCTST